MPKFQNIPAGSRVLASFDGANYYVPFFNKNKIQIAPAMEIGANDRGVQQLVYEITIKHNLSCKELSKYEFNYVVEQSLESIPSCLKLVDIKGNYRLWKIIN